MDQPKLAQWLKKYSCVLVILLAGIVFMVLPDASGDTEEPQVTEQEEVKDVEARLQQILSRVDGAGEVNVMLTESAGENIIYQSDHDGTDTVVISGADHCEQGLIQTRISPVYRGAIVVCTGADHAAVRLAIVEAVANITGLGADKITVLKMK